MIHIHGLGKEDWLLLKHILKNQPDRGPNTEARALFESILAAFDGSSGEAIVVNSCMVHNLAACGWIALEYDADKKIPWDSGEHDYVLLRTLKGFASCLIGAIRDQRCRFTADGGAIINTFSVPKEFVQRARECAYPSATLNEAAEKLYTRS